MDITFTCEKCGQSIEIDETGAGLQVRCPKCGTPLLVPTTNGQAASRQASEASAPTSDTKKCPYCAETIKAEAKFCRFCNHDLVTGQSGLPAPTTASPKPSVTDGTVAELSKQLLFLAQKKSIGIAFVLTFFFGPLGMFYSTVEGGIIMLIITTITVMITFFTFGFGLFLMFIVGLVCIIWGMIAASEHNEKLLAHNTIVADLEVPTDVCDFDVTCPQCKTEWELTAEEASLKEFQCPECKHLFSPANQRSSYGHCF